MTDRSAFGKQVSGQGAPSARNARKGAYTLWVCAACVVALLLAAPTAFPASPRVGEILSGVEGFYSHLQNYHVVVRQENLSRYSSAVSFKRSVITLDAAGPERARLTLSGDGLNAEVVSNGNTIWYYIPTRKAYLEREAAPSGGGPGKQASAATRSDLLGQMQDKLVERFARISRFEKVAEVKGRGKVKFQGAKIPCYKVLLHLKDSMDQLWIDPSSFRVLREEETRQQQDLAGVAMVTSTTQITELAANPTRVAGFFTFRPPKGATRVAALALPGFEQSYISSTPESFTLPDVEGGQVSLSDYRGKTVLLSFWATWCPPCKKELPTLQKLYEQHNKNLMILAVDDEDRTTIKDFLKGNHYSFRALVDSKRTLFKKFAVHFIPTVFVINREGIVTQQLTGWEGPQRLMEALRAAGFGNVMPAPAQPESPGKGQHQPIAFSKQETNK